MGIQQLLPFLSKCTEQVNISQFEGWTVAVDAYCWLHKGSYACSEELLLGTPTDKYCQYILKFINMLIRHKIKPVLVFDGQKLQAKAETELGRQEKRRTASIAARRLLLDGNRSEAKKYLGQAISVTSAMAHDVIEACRAIGVDCIVAQYEADAQLAYLSLAGLVHLVISEDSDLLVFGCRRVLFKLDLSGRGELIEQDRLGEVFGGDFSFEKFRYMCILSGCDYLDGVEGIGLTKALRVFRRAKQSDIRKILANLSGYLGRAVTLRPSYIDDFVKASNTFLYQLVYDPVERCVSPLNPRPKNLSATDFPCGGKELEANVALNLSLGNLDPYTLKPFNGSAMWQPPNNGSSIWSQEYQLPKTPPRKAKENSSVSKTTVSSSSVRVVVASWGSTASPAIGVNNRKRKTSPERISSASSITQLTTKSELVRLYGNKCSRLDEEAKSVAIVIDESDPEDGGDGDCIELSTTSATSSSPTIISQTSRLIRRNVFSASASLSSRVANSQSACDFFGVMTPPSTQLSARSETDSTISPYFQANCHNARASSTGKGLNTSPLASRLASKRIQCQLQSSELPSFATTPETKASECNTSEDVVFVSDDLPTDQQSSNNSSEVDKLPSKENNPGLLNTEAKPVSISSEKTASVDSKAHENVAPANFRQSAPLKSGGAVRLLLEKFAFKSGRS